jgi:hypothetical protein
MFPFLLSSYYSVELLDIFLITQYLSLDDMLF